MPAPAKIRRSPIYSLSRATALGALKENDNRKKRRSLISMERRRIDPNQCADKHLGAKFRKRGNPLYLAFLIGRAKSTLNYAIFNFSLMSISFLSALTAGRVRPSTRTLFAFSRRGPCVPSRSARGRRMLFIRFINRAVQAVWRSHHEGRKQARDSGHSPFRGPARGRSPRARISILAPFHLTGGNTDSRLFVVIRAVGSLRRFQLQPLRHLGAEADFEITSVDPHAMQDAGKLARDSHDRA